MLPRPSILRASQLVSRQVRSPVFRNTLQQRFASNEPTKLVGPMDNAFNRERLAVKQHAAASAGRPLPAFPAESRLCADLRNLDLWRKLCI